MKTGRGEIQSGAADNAGVCRQGSVQPAVPPTRRQEESQRHDPKGQQVCLEMLAVGTVMCAKEVLRATYSPWLC